MAATIKTPAVQRFRQPFAISEDGFAPPVTVSPLLSGSGCTGYRCNRDFGAPPPPPLPVKGQLPAQRLPTQLPAEAPACVQNAMMTKDKKPFTYTPGGIDLSQIKSPRMAKRVQKNAMSEGVSGGPKVSPLAQPNQTQLPTQSPADMGAFAVGMPFQVLPPPPPPPPAKNQAAPKPATNGSAPRNNNQPMHFEPPPMGLRPEIKIPPNPMANLRSAPRPKPQDDFWIEEYKQEKAATEPLHVEVPPPAPVRATTPQPTPPISAQQASPQPPTPPQKSSSKAPLSNLYIPSPGQEDRQQLLNQLSPPWMSSKSAKVETPEWAHRNEGERVIPIQVERSPRTPVTPSLGPQPFYGASTPSSAGFELPTFAQVTPPQPPSMQYTPQYNNPNQYVNQYQHADYNRQNPYSPTPAGTRVIPIRVEGAPSPVSPHFRGPAMQSPVIMQRGNVKFLIRDVPIEVQIGFIKRRLHDPRSFHHQQSPTPGWGNNHSNAPTQSRSFKILQKITDSYTDGSESDNSAVNPPQGLEETDRMRRMKLSEDDQKFMGSIRSQVDDERYLHKEEDPRYRGAAIPSKAFRYLQNQINDPSVANFSAPINRPRGRPQGRPEYEEDEGPPKPYVPPSEQQVYEPKKYTGANIPSRSFRLLQAMTQPENAAQFAEYFQQLPDPSAYPFPYPTPFPPYMNPYFMMPPPFSFFDKDDENSDDENSGDEKKEESDSKPQGAKKPPELTEDLDLDRLKDMEIIDLLDDTTKSILESLRALHLQYGLNFEESEEGSRKAAALLSSENKASIYSSLNNLLRRDQSTSSMPLSERNKEADEEKLNLLKSLTNLLKAERGIRSRLNSTSSAGHSRSRLNSCSERDEDHTPRASPLPEEGEQVDEQVEGDDVNFWDLLNKDDDDYKPPKRDWSYRNSYSAPEGTNGYETEAGDADDEADEEPKAKEMTPEKPPSPPKKPQKVDAGIMTDIEQTDDESSKEKSRSSETKETKSKDKTESDQYMKMMKKMWKKGFYQNVWQNMYYPPGYPQYPGSCYRASSPFQPISQYPSYTQYPQNMYPPHATSPAPPYYGQPAYPQTNGYLPQQGYNQNYSHWSTSADEAYSDQYEEEATPTKTTHTNGYSSEPQHFTFEKGEYETEGPPRYGYASQNGIYPSQELLAVNGHEEEETHEKTPEVEPKVTSQNLEKTLEINQRSTPQNTEKISEISQKYLSQNTEKISEISQSYTSQNTEKISGINQKYTPQNTPDMNQRKTPQVEVAEEESETESEMSEEHDRTTRTELISPPSTFKEISENQTELIVEDYSETINGDIVEGKIMIIPSSKSTDSSRADSEGKPSSILSPTYEKMNRIDQSSESEHVVVYQIEDELSDEHEQTNVQEMSEEECEEEQEFEEIENGEVIESDDEEPENIVYKNNIAEHLPHQLSIIFEVTEHSERGSVRSSSVDDSSENEAVPSETEIESAREDCDSVRDVSVKVSVPLRRSFDRSSSEDRQRSESKTPVAETLEEEQDVSVSVSLSLKRYATNEAIDKCTYQEQRSYVESEDSDYETRQINSKPAQVPESQLPKRASSVPPRMEVDSDEALQKRLQTLREQWSAITKEVNTPKPVEEPELQPHNWKIMFFEAFPTKSEEKPEKSPPRTDKVRMRRMSVDQDVLTHQWNPPKLLMPQLVESEKPQESQIQVLQKPQEAPEPDSWWPKRRVAAETPEDATPTNEGNWWPKNKVKEEEEQEHWWPKRKVSQPEKPKSPTPEPENWWPKRKVNAPEPEPEKEPENWWPKNKVKTPVKEPEPEPEPENWWPKRKVAPEKQENTSKSPLRYRMIEVQQLNSSDTESEYEESQAETSEQTDSEHSSTKLSPQMADSPRRMSEENTYTVSYRLSRSKSRLSSRPNSCTMEMEVESRSESVTREIEAQSENLRYIRATSITRESPVPERSWESYVPRPPKSPIVDWNRDDLSQSQRLEWPNSRAHSVTPETRPSRLTPDLRPASCTRELTPMKTSSLFRQLSINMEDSSPQPSRPASCTVELDILVAPTPPPPQEPEPSVVRRRPKRGRQRPVSAVGNLENCRNSLEGSKLEAMAESLDDSQLETVVEINHVPSRPSSCTREIETYWSGRGRPDHSSRSRRSHSVTREITLCPSAGQTERLGDRLGERRMSVRDRIAAFETFEPSALTPSGSKKKVLSVKSSIDESDCADDDSGVQSTKYDSEVGTDTEGFPELRKMAPYQRANTQSKLFQYLQECVNEEDEEQAEAEPQVPQKPRKIVHNVSVTRRQNPERIKEAETVEQRRQRLSLPLVHQHSSGLESVESSVASPSSPVREKLASELVQSLLIKKDGRQFRNIPLERLHAAALKILQEEEALNRVASGSTIDSTPALTPSEFQADSPSYEQYHASFQAPCDDEYDYSMFPSKAFKKVHDQVCRSRRGSLKRSPSTATNFTFPNPHSHSPSPFRTLPPSSDR